MECKEGLLHSRRLMESAIKSGRKNGIYCVRDVTEWFYGGADGSGLIGYRERIGELPAFEC